MSQLISILPLILYMDNQLTFRNKNLIYHENFSTFFICNYFIVPYNGNNYTSLRK